MNTFDQSTNGKRPFVIFLILAILFFLASCVFGYLWYKNLSETNNVSSDEAMVTTLAQKDSEIAALKAQITALQDTAGQPSADLTKENTTLKDENSSLKNNIASYQTKITKTIAYNDFLKYMVSVIDAHDGFSGWTEGEFQTAQTKAQATSNTAFVSTVNWAWYETSVNPLERVIRTFNETAAGIENALK